MIDYDFYISSFRGDAIPAEDWNTCEARAAAQLARYKRIYTVKAPEENSEPLPCAPWQRLFTALI